MKIESEMGNTKHGIRNPRHETRTLNPGTRNLLKFQTRTPKPRPQTPISQEDADHPGAGSYTIDNCFSEEYLLRCSPLSTFLKRLFYAHVQDVYEAGHVTKDLSGGYVTCLSVGHVTTRGKGATRSITTSPRNTLSGVLMRSCLYTYCQITVVV